MSRLPVLALAVGFFIAAALASNDAGAFCRMTTKDKVQVGNSTCSGEGIPLEWRDACLQYSIDARGSMWMSLGDVESAVSASFETWQNQTCSGGELTNVIFTMGANSTCRQIEFNERGPNLNTVAFLDPWVRDGDLSDPLPPNAFALTNVFFRENTGQILDADMLINETLGPYDSCPDSGCPPGSPGPADLQSIVTHEAGHFIGIGHSDVAEATMFASAPRTEVTKRTLAADDIDAICTIYPPGNLNASCDSTPIGGLDLNCEDSEPPPTSASGSGGCSAAPRGQRLPWETTVIAVLALMALRRRSFRRDARY
ncbi:MAG: matrixin family metalloprotease [Polyangiales bacterium]